MKIPDSNYYWDNFLPDNPEKFLEWRSSCPNCSQNELIYINSVPPTGIFRCAGCGLIFTSPLFSDTVQTRLYRENQGDMSAQKNNQLADYMNTRFDTMKKEMFNPGRISDLSMVEIGCGWGHFLKRAEKEFKQVCGYEISLKQSAWARENLGLSVSHENIFDISIENKWSVICLWEVLEHINIPGKMFRWCFDHLEPGGQLIISVPNYNALSRMLLGKHWFYHIPTQHISYFTSASIKRLLKNSGLKTVKTRTSGRSRLRERFNQHNKIDTETSLRSQWLQSLTARTKTELERDLSSRSGAAAGILDKIGWHLHSTAAKFGAGEQLRVYALKPEH